MNVVIAGASGLIGTALAESLSEDGHTVRPLVRRTPKSDDEIAWDPANHLLDESTLIGADAVVNLAGAGIGDRRWSASYKRLIVNSRVDSTSTLAEALTCDTNTVRVLVNASAVGWYGDRGDDVLTEAEPVGDGYLADLVRQWEASTAPAEDAGVRVVRIRSGIVMSPHGGALGRMLPLFRLGVGGRLGSGNQWVPWIAIDDEIAAIRFAIDNAAMVGSYNLTAPTPVTNRELTKTLAGALVRPAFAAVPRTALRIAFGDFADEGLLASQRAVPEALRAAGFSFRFEQLDEALESMLATSRGPSRTGPTSGVRHKKR